MPPTTKKLALPAVELLKKLVELKPTLLNDALPAVELLKKFVELEPNPTLVMLAPPAVELLKKFVEPSCKMDTLFPAVALLVKTSVPSKLRFCVFPELFVMPTPLTVSVSPVLKVIV